MLLLLLLLLRKPENPEDDALVELVQKRHYGEISESERKQLDMIASESSKRALRIRKIELDLRENRFMELAVKSYLRPLEKDEEEDFGALLRTRPVNVQIYQRLGEALRQQVEKRKREAGMEGEGNP
jgi:hypothetical protein